MTLEWRDTQDGVDWNELTELYRLARLVELSRQHKKIILYAEPGKEPFYRKLGFLRIGARAAQPQAAQLCRGGVSIGRVKSKIRSVV